MPRSTLEGNKRNRDVLLTYIRERPFCTQNYLKMKTGWSKSYISKLIGWLDRDKLVGYTWGKDDRGRRRRQYIEL